MNGRLAVFVLLGPWFAVGSAAQAPDPSLAIGVFDSGTGGLAVLEQIVKMDRFDNRSRAAAPQGDGQPDFQRERFIFLADQANMPYGNYPVVGKEAFLRELIESDARFLVDEAGGRKPRIKALVIACNTATAYGKPCLEALLAPRDIAVIGVIDAGAQGAIESLAQDRPDAIGVLATEGTVASGAYPQAIAAAARVKGLPADVPVVQQGAYGLAAAVDGIREFILHDPQSDRPRADYQGPTLTHAQFPIDQRLLSRYAFDFSQHRMLWTGERDHPSALQINSVENYLAFHLVSLLERVRSGPNAKPLATLVLGCTHFPYLADAIRAQLQRLYAYREDGQYIYRACLAKDVRLVDPAVYVGQELYRRLADKGRLANSAAWPPGTRRGEFYITVPRRDRPHAQLDADGGFTYQYKYGRTPGHPLADVRVVPFAETKFSAETTQRLSRQTPGVWSLVSASHSRPKTPGAERPVEAGRGMVVSVSPPGSDVGLAVLKQGGNAVDAAVATAFALAVTWPAAGNIGGGGFMMVYPGPGQDPKCVEYRETAPAAACATTLVDVSRTVGHRVVGVPGTVAGLALAHRTYGKLPWRELVLPAVRLARGGFPVDQALADSLNGILRSAAGFAEMQRVFAPLPRRDRWRQGDRFAQPDLGRTLQTLADQGPDAFYKGTLADGLVAEMQAGGGLITKADLAAYQANLRRPIHGTYRGYDVYAVPPPSGGGVTLVLMLNILENFPLGKQAAWNAADMHLVIEAMRRAYCDRARYLGDPAFTAIPAFLTSKEYARKLAGPIDPRRATRSELLAGEIPLAAESSDTTHFSVIDSAGMAVANTYTLENSYGSRVMVRGGGYLLNNEMTDFNRIPGRTDRSGRIGTPPNVIAPGKRMLSSQTPTLVVEKGQLRIVTGSPGGRTITNTVLCTLLGLVDRGLDVRQAVDAPRLHHQWFPDRVQFEGLNNPAYRAELDALRQMGHVLAERPSMQGDAHTIWIDRHTGVYFGAADHRIAGKAAGY